MRLAMGALTDLQRFVFLGFVWAAFPRHRYAVQVLKLLEELLVVLVNIRTAAPLGLGLDGEAVMALGVVLGLAHPSVQQLG